MDTPLGRISLICSGAALCGLRFGADARERRDDLPLLRQAERELEEYFSGRRRVFSVPLRLRGTDFQIRVWNALREIPYGETASYADIAARIGNRKACRAVGMANNKNPIPLFIPCHRVIGADGRLAGYAGGPENKRYLLELEGVHVKI